MGLVGSIAAHPLRTDVVFPGCITPFLLHSRTHLLRLMKLVPQTRILYSIRQLSEEQVPSYEWFKM
jgi:hypothetical protein